MAAIRETLILVDQFSRTFSRYLNMGKQAASTAQAASAANADYSSKMAELAGACDKAASDLSDLGNKFREAGEGANGAARKQERANRSMNSGAKAADKLASRLKSLAAAYIGLQSAQKLINLSDAWTQTTARLDRMNDKAQSTPELQGMIYQSAQRSRGDYLETADMVAKLGTMAPEAFGSTAEVVAFAEQINKQFALAGTSAQGAQAAMLQLTQAMSSGTLRGEELNSVLEQAPTIAQAIAKYLDTDIGTMRELASEGEITANVVKAALFSAAEETNAAFEAVPLTFSSAWTLAKNAAVNAFRPALEELNGLLNSGIGRDALNGLIYAVQLAGQWLTWLIQKTGEAARWVADNWETVSAVLIGLAVGVAAVMAASAVQSAAAWMAANWQLVLIVGTIALVIYAATQMGATFEDVCGFIGGILYELYAFGYNLTADAWNLIATFAEFFANVFNNPVAAIAHLFAGLADWVLGILQSLASAIDAVFGSNLAGAVNGWRSNVQSWADSFGGNEIQIRRMEKIGYDDAWDKGTEAGKKFGSFLDGIRDFSPGNLLGEMGGSPFDYDALLSNSGIPGALDSIGNDVGAIKKSVSLSEEDMKMLVDMAERQYVNNINLTAQTPVINVNGQNTGSNEADGQWLADTLKKMLIEQAASHTDLDYQ